MTPTLAIDPGYDGAAVLLDTDGTTILGAWAWHRLKATKTLPLRYEVSVRGKHPVDVFPTLDMVGRWVAICASKALGDRRCTMVVEGLFVKGRRQALSLSWAAGIVASPCLALAVNAAEIEDWRPMATTWRPAMLRIPGNHPDAVKVALRLAPATFSGLGELEASPHACEAAFQARWGWTRQKVEARIGAYRRV